jgi:hypothetical protein
MGKVLCIAHLPPISLKKQATTNKQTAQTEAATLIQRFDDEHPVHHISGNLLLSRFILDELVTR